MVATRLPALYRYYLHIRTSYSLFWCHIRKNIRHAENVPIHYQDNWSCSWLSRTVIKTPCPLVVYDMFHAFTSCKYSTSAQIAFDWLGKTFASKLKIAMVMNLSWVNIFTQHHFPSSNLSNYIFFMIEWMKTESCHVVMLQFNGWICSNERKSTLPTYWISTFELRDIAYSVFMDVNSQGCIWLKCLPIELNIFLNQLLSNIFFVF